MLRRLPEEHKLHAMSYIQPHGQRNKNDSPRESQEVRIDSLSHLVARNVVLIYFTRHTFAFRPTKESGQQIAPWMNGSE